MRGAAVGGEMRFGETAPTGGGVGLTPKDRRARMGLSALCQARHLNPTSSLSTLYLTPDFRGVSGGFTCRDAKARIRATFRNGRWTGNIVGREVGVTASGWRAFSF